MIDVQNLIKSRSKTKSSMSNRNRRENTKNWLFYLLELSYTKIWMDSTLHKKQTYLRKEILEAGVDPD